MSPPDLSSANFPKAALTTQLLITPSSLCTLPTPCQVYIPHPSARIRAICISIFKIMMMASRRTPRPLTPPWVFPVILSQDPCPSTLIMAHLGSGHNWGCPLLRHSTWNRVDLLPLPQHPFPSALTR
ncbi:hypothetical protein A0H81_06812 [Grifola frondosa]|uniref:Uncharacterized protein n=1 Tax=Grifola frondosa TaxID=5627 RepID=A0A1C7M8Q5_GRIFR|nr:hypothetical protein A0H81_06812 [Grifola frondosa]